MTRPTKDHTFLRNHNWTLTLAVILIIFGALFVVNLRNNPPGFYIDESSIAYNANLIAHTGKDEHGQTFPLFFRAFGEYKNPVYIYLLAAIFRLTGPSILVGRLLSAALVYLAGLVMGFLAWRISKRRDLALIMLAATLLTPWLFELSRVVLEVAIYPLALAVFLLILQSAAQKNRWSWLDSAGIALMLTLLTYSYSIGRLFAPLLAVGLILFGRGVGWKSIARAWSLYVLALIPLLIFQWRYPGALTSRFHLISYATSQSSYSQLAWEFVRHYMGNLNPWRMVVSGDPNNRQIVTIYGLGQILAATFILAVLGIYVVIRNHRREPWWRFVLYGLVVSAVPASLTKEYFHVLRLAPLPIFILLFCIPALMWLIEHRATRAWRVALLFAVVLTFMQGALFQWQYHVYGRSPYRAQLFDAEYPAKILPTALLQPSRPIYLADAEPIPGYIQAFWYATLQHIPITEFKRLPFETPVPAESVAITTENIRPRCHSLAQVEPYTVCLVQGEPQKALPAEKMRAEMRALDAPSRLRTTQQTTIRVFVKNTGDALWLARERSAASLQLSLGNHWLDSSGREVIHDDGRAPLPQNLRPGEETQLQLTVNAPRSAGDYILELDMLQEGVSWFASQGSPTIRLSVKIE